MAASALALCVAPVATAAPPDADADATQYLIGACYDPSQQAIEQPTVARERRHDERLAHPLRHRLEGFGCDSHDRRERKEELAVCEWMFGRVAEHDRRLEIGAAVHGDEPGSLTMAGRDIAGARRLEAGVDLL